MLSSGHAFLGPANPPQLLPKYAQICSGQAVVSVGSQLESGLLMQYWSSESRHGAREGPHGVWVGGVLDGEIIKREGGKRGDGLLRLR